MKMLTANRERSFAKEYGWSLVVLLAFVFELLRPSSVFVREAELSGKNAWTSKNNVIISHLDETRFVRPAPRAGRIPIMDLDLTSEVLGETGGSEIRSWDFETSRTNRLSNRLLTVSHGAEAQLHIGLDLLIDANSTVDVNVTVHGSKTESEKPVQALNMHINYSPHSPPAQTQATVKAQRLMI